GIFSGIFCAKKESAGDFSVVTGASIAVVVEGIALLVGDSIQGAGFGRAVLAVAGLLGRAVISDTASEETTGEKGRRQKECEGDACIHEHVLMQQEICLSWRRICSRALRLIAERETMGDE